MPSRLGQRGDCPTIELVMEDMAELLECGEHTFRSSHCVWRRGTSAESMQLGAAAGQVCLEAAVLGFVS